MVDDSVCCHAYRRRGAVGVCPKLTDRAVSLYRILKNRCILSYISMEKKSVLISFIILLLVAIAGSSAGIYYYYQYQTLLTRSNDPNIAAKDLLAKVGKLIDLPTSEQPTIATVTNPDLIKNQPFFAKAKKGDRVILYPTAKLAILFDETANKIINFGSINEGSSPSATSVNKVATPTP